MSNIETQLISKIIETGDLIVVNDMQITPRFFTGRNRVAFRFITRHQTKYGKVPSADVFKKKHPKLKLSDAPESLRYYCDEIRNKRKHNTLVDGMDEATELIDKLETDEAYKIIQQVISKIEQDIILTDRQEVTKNTEQRWNDYETRKNMGGMTGIPSGIDRLDYTLKGYNGGELITLLGYTGTGKTWFELIQAVYMAKQGYKVLFFTTEMSTKMIIRRIDAIWCKLSYTRFRDGRLTKDEEKRYKAYLSKMEGDTDTNLIVEQATAGVTQVSAKIDQHKPDIVFVDGAYLLSDDASDEDDWKSHVRVWRALHSLALVKKLPIYVSTQIKEEKASLGAIAFAKAIAADCDVIMALEQDQEMKADKEIKLKFLKVREGDISHAIYMNWDFDKMKYDTIYSEGGDNKPDDDDEETELPSGVQEIA